MPAPDKYSWVEKPHLAAMARPTEREEFTWLRSQGIQLILSLTESPLRRDWVNDAGLMAVHVPVVDLTAPTQEQFEHCLSVIRRARDQKLGIAVHCTAGLGRTGTLLAVWFVSQGLRPAAAIAKVRELRPGSIETPEQERAVYQFVNSARESLVSASRKIDEAFDRARELAEDASDQKTFFDQIIEITAEGINAHAAAIWMSSKTGFLQLHSQFKIEDVFLDKHKNGRQSHNELLRQAFQLARPMLLEPYGTSGILEGLPAGNPTDYFCLLVPIQLQQEVRGIMELWIDQKHNMQMQRTFLNYLVQMAGYVSQFMRNIKSEEED